MPSCVFRKCYNYERKVNKQHGVAYHMFPVDEDRLRDWVAVVRAQRLEFDWVPSKSSKICSIHFRKEDKRISEKGRILLKHDSVPIITKDYVVRNHIAPAYRNHEQGDGDDNDADHDWGGTADVVQVPEPIIETNKESVVKLEVSEEEEDSEEELVEGCASISAQGAWAQHQDAVKRRPRSRLELELAALSTQMRAKLGALPLAEARRAQDDIRAVLARYPLRSSPKQS